MKKYFLFDKEQISGRTYVLRLIVSVLLLFFLVGIWLVASTAYKRARSLGWDEGFSNIISFLIIIHLSVGSWPDSLFESGSYIFIITIPLYILQLYMVFKNAMAIKSSYTVERIGRRIGKYLYDSKNNEIKELKKLKELLDLELITQDEFDKKSKELKKIILDNKKLTDSIVYPVPKLKKSDNTLFFLHINKLIKSRYSIILGLFILIFFFKSDYDDFRFEARVLYHVEILNLLDEEKLDDIYLRTGFGEIESEIDKLYVAKKIGSKNNQSIRPSLIDALNIEGIKNDWRIKKLQNTFPIFINNNNEFCCGFNYFFAIPKIGEQLTNTGYWKFSWWKVLLWIFFSYLISLSILIIISSIPFLFKKKYIDKTIKVSSLIITTVLSINILASFINQEKQLGEAPNTTLNPTTTPNKSPESLAEYFLEYAKEGNLLDINIQINYNDRDKRLSFLRTWNKWGREKLPNGESKQITLINYYKEKYKNASIKEIEKISEDILVIKISKVANFKGKETKYETELVFAGNFNGEWYVIGMLYNLSNKDYDAIGNKKANEIKKYILSIQ